MIIREASVTDIPQIQIVRNSVKENQLSDPRLVTDRDCEIFMTIRGKAWVCKIDNKIVGFSYVDLKENNIWALFVEPSYENKGIGKKLHDVMLDWYFIQTQEKVWLGTAPNTRAEKFYKMSGWKMVGTHGKGEVKFEMSFSDWSDIKKKKNVVNL